MNPLEAFRLADQVTHHEWGTGRVLATKELSEEERGVTEHCPQGDHPRWCVKVNFEDHGKKFVGTGTLRRVTKERAER